MNRCPSTCRSKVGYATKGEAETHADRLRIVVPFRKVRVYRCGTCRKWYVTSDDRPRSKRKR